MKSKIAEAIRCAHHPVALSFSDEKPAKSIQFAKGKWGCVMWLYAAAAKGRTAVADVETYGCIGGGVGLGFGNQYESWPGGIECFYYFLSTGNEQWEKGREAADGVKRYLRDESFDNFVRGERYIKSPELVEKFVANLPIMEVPTRYVVFSPLEALDEADEVDERGRPELVIFTVPPDQLSALVILANYARETSDNVIIPHAAGCQTLGILALREARSDPQRAVVGLTDLSARAQVNKRLGPNLMTFAVPWKMFEEMESNVEGSFLERPLWKSIIESWSSDK